MEDIEYSIEDFDDRISTKLEDMSSIHSYSDDFTSQDEAKSPFSPQSVRTASVGSLVKDEPSLDKYQSKNSPILVKEEEVDEVKEEEEEDFLEENTSGFIHPSGLERKVSKYSSVSEGVMEAGENFELNTLKMHIKLQERESSLRRSKSRMLSSLDKKKLRANKRRAEHQAKLRTAEEEAAKWKAEADQARGLMGSLQVELNSMKAKVKARASEMDAKAASDDRMIRKLKEREMALEANGERLLAKMLEKEGAWEEERQMVREKARGEALKEKARLEAVALDLQAERKRLAEERMEFQKEKAVMNERMKCMEESFLKREKQSEKWLQDERERLVLQFSATTTEFHAKERKVEVEMREVDNLKKTMLEEQSRVLQDRKELGMTREVLASERNALRAERERMQQELSDAKRRYDLAVQKADYLEAQVREVNQERTEMQALKQTLFEKEKELIRQSSAVEALKCEVELVDKELVRELQQARDAKQRAAKAQRQAEAREKEVHSVKQDLDAKLVMLNSEAQIWQNSTAELRRPESADPLNSEDGLTGIWHSEGVQRMLNFGNEIPSWLKSE